LPSGSFTERYGSCHLKYQFVHAARHWFSVSDTSARPSNATLDSAIAIYESEYTDYKNYIDGITGSYNKTAADFSSKHLPAHRILTPTEVGL
jgi:hypothetical protein